MLGRASDGEKAVSARSTDSWVGEELDTRNSIDKRDALGDAPFGGILLWLMLGHGDYHNSGRWGCDATSVAMEVEGRVTGGRAMYCVSRDG